MFGFGKCKKCQTLEKENTYLRTLVDRLLAYVNVTPVDVMPAIGSQVEHSIKEEEERPGVLKETFGEG
jgi:hypothetical protein